MSGHWTSRSTRDFVYRISSDFALQIENKMDEKRISQSALAKKLGVSDSRVSQVLRNPGNLTLKKMVEYARSLGLKVSIVAYDDSDADNKNGPINSQIFNLCWERTGRPTDFFAVRESTGSVFRSFPAIRYVGCLGEGDKRGTPDTVQLRADLNLEDQKSSTTDSLVFDGGC